jgi:CP family cyanate transporter-like MFS transporter
MGKNNMQSTTEITARTNKRYETLLIVAIILVAIDLRPGIVAIGPVLPTMIEEFHMSHTVASLMTAIPDLLMGMLALPTPWLVRRFGVNLVLQLALGLLCVAMLLRAFSPNVPTLLGSTIGVGAGIAIAGALFGGLIKTRFTNRVALIMGIYTTAISLGSALSAGTTGWIAQTLGLGWRTATGVWSVLGVVAIIAWWMVTRIEPQTPTVTAVKAPTTGLPFRNKTAWLIALYFAGVNFLFYSLITWTAPLYQEHGLSSATAGLILASFTIAFMCSSPLVGAFSKSTDRRLWLAGAALITTVGLIGIVATPGQLPFVWLPLCAIGMGAAFTLSMTLPLDNTHTADEANRWSAFNLMVGYLIAATGPLLTGYLRDVSGAFTLPFTMLVGVAVIMLAATPFLKPHVAR